MALEESGARLGTSFQQDFSHVHETEQAPGQGLMSGHDGYCTSK